MFILLVRRQQKLLVTDTSNCLLSLSHDQIIKDLNYANATSSRFLHYLKDVLLLFLESDERATCSISAIAVKSTYNDPSNTPITVIAYNISMSTDDVPHTLTVLNNATLRGDLAFLLNLRGNYVITDITGPYTSTTILKPTLATAPTLSPTRDPTMRTPFKQAHTSTSVDESGA